MDLIDYKFESLPDSNHHWTEERRYYRVPVTAFDDWNGEVITRTYTLEVSKVSFDSPTPDRWHVYCRDSWVTVDGVKSYEYNPDDPEASGSNDLCDTPTGKNLIEKVKGEFRTGIVPADYVERMKLIPTDYSYDGHIDADSLLCELLERLGYGAVTEVYHNIRKWFA